MDCASGCVVSAGGDADAVLGRVGDGLGGDAELLVDTGVVGGRPVVLDGDAAAVVADDLVPALFEAGFDGDPRLDRRGDNGLAVRRLLIVEPLTARHRDDPRPN